MILCPDQIPPRPCSSPWTTSIESSGPTPRAAMAHRGEAEPGLWGVGKEVGAPRASAQASGFPPEGTSTIGSWMRPGKIYFVHIPRQPVPVPSTAWLKRCGWAWTVQGTRRGWHTDLLTHALALPSYHLQKPFTPVKYFSIDRVFRNETLDATHLAEFHQIEGVVADHGLTLGHLMGVLREFFTKLGEHAGQGRQCWWSLSRMPGSPALSSTQVSPNYASSRPTTPTLSPAWRCSATTKVRVGGKEISGCPLLAWIPSLRSPHPTS